MSRYVLHPYGLSIGSGNHFFVIDQEDEPPPAPPLVLPEGVDSLRDGYTALLSWRPYALAHINSVNYNVRTPAHQLVWRQRRLSWERPYQPKQGPAIMLPMQRDYYVLGSHFEQWLAKHVGARYSAWDTYTRGARSSSTLFFAKRKHALALCRYIAEQLRGVPSGGYRR